jgi:hypothetical protein
MPWAYIRHLLGPGLLWLKPREVISKAIEQAQSDRNEAAVGHLRLIRERNDLVRFEQPPKDEL